MRKLLLLPLLFLTGCAVQYVPSSYVAPDGSVVQTYTPVAAPPSVYYYGYPTYYQTPVPIPYQPYRYVPPNAYVPYIPPRPLPPPVINNYYGRPR